MSRRGQLTESQINEILNLYFKSVPISKIAKLYRQGRPTIYKVLELNEVSLHHHIVRDIPEDCLSDIVELYNLGYATTTISDCLGCATSLVIRQLKNAGIKRRSMSESKTRSHNIKPLVDTIDDEEWIATATVPEIIERMKELARESDGIH